MLALPCGPGRIAWRRAGLAENQGKEAYFIERMITWICSLSQPYIIGCTAVRLHCVHRGHASEKPELPAALAQTASKIQFLGPSADAMAALGDKVGVVYWKHL